MDRLVPGKYKGFNTERTCDECGYKETYSARRERSSLVGGGVKKIRCYGLSGHGKHLCDSCAAPLLAG
jgi:hypothetical protein